MSTKATTDKPILAPESVKRARLANGLTILARRDASAPVVAIVTWVRAGYFDETDDIVGIAHVLEHMYFKGTPTHGVGEIARATKAAGGYLNAGTIYDHTHYYTVLPSSGWRAGLAVQADAYANSVIDADELRRELEVIIEETRRKADSAGALALETMFALLHDEHRIRRWRMGREEGLRALTRDQLVKFYRDYYRPSNTVLAIVGDVDPDEAIAEATRHYGALADAKVPQSPRPSEKSKPGFRVKEWEGDIAQSELVFGWRTPGTMHPDSPALDLLSVVLTGGRAARLVRATRDRHLVSSIQAYDYTPTEIGVFVVHASGRPERMAEAAKTIHDQIQRVRASEIRPDELERARRMIEAQWLRRLEDADGQANFLGAWELLGDWQKGVEYHDAVLATTPERLADVAKQWLDPWQASVVAYRPRGSAPLGADAEAVRRLLESARIEPVEPAAAPTAPRTVAPSKPTLERITDGVHVFRTSEGVPILVKPRPGAALTHFGCFVAGGVVSENTANGGVTTLMARTMLRGTGRRSATRLAEDAELLGGTPVASVGTESMQWAIGVPAASLPGAVELLADVVLDPSFPQDGLEAERVIALAALDTLRDDMHRQPLRLAAELAWPDHPYGRSTLGTAESLRAVTTDAMRAWHVANVRKSPALLAVVGDVDPAATAAMIAAHFSALRNAPLAPIARPAWPKQFATRVEQRDKAQTALSILFEGPARDDAARFDAELIAGVASGLGGRLFEELRDKQSLAYVVIARPYVRRVSGTFSAYIATAPAKEEQARAGLLAEFAKMREREVTAEELERARQYAIGAWQIRQSSGAAVLGELADAWMHDALEEIARYPDDLRAVTARSMRESAERWFDPARRQEGIVRGTKSTG